MTTQMGCVSRARRVIGALAFVACLTAQPARAATDYSDLWWVPFEGGWGVTFTQSDDFIFATFFIYGTSGLPDWYTGQMSRDVSGIWSGPLFVTRGTYFGVPWNPANNGIRQVGTVTFTPSSDSVGALTYNVDGVVVNKNITRQTLKTIPLGGDYIGGLVVDVFNCSNPLANRTENIFTQLAVVQTAPPGSLTIDFGNQNGVTCRMTGDYTQLGQLYRVQPAQYACVGGGGLSTTATLYEVKASAQGIEGRWIASIGGGCTESGTFTGTLR